MHNNRILKFMKEEPPMFAKVVVVSDEVEKKVVMSYGGDKIMWRWVDNGLECPGLSSKVEIHPLAAEALIVEEIVALLRMEGVDTREVTYVNTGGEKIDGVRMSPPFNEDGFELIVKKEKIKELYETFVAGNDKLTEDIIGQAISYGVLNPLLSLVNL